MTQKAKLRLALGAFFIGLAIPSIALIWQALERLQWEAFHQHQALAKDFSQRLEARLDDLMRAENARPYTEFFYFNAVSPQSVNLLQRSPLATLAPTVIPGLLGHFHVAGFGELQLPFLPQPGVDATQAGLTPEQLVERQILGNKLRAILSDNRLLQAPPVRQVHEMRAAGQSADIAASVASAPQVNESQAAFDALTRDAEQDYAGGRELKKQLKLEDRYAAKAPAEKSKSAAYAVPRKERNVLPAVTLGQAASTEVPATPERIAVFESEIDAYQIASLTSGHIVAYRKVWRNGQREVQGFLLDRDRFFNELFAEPFRVSLVAAASRLGVVYRGEVAATFAGGDARRYASDASLVGTLLYQARLAAPFSDFELVFSLARLPYGPGGRVIGWLAALLVSVLVVGIWGLYRLGMRQMTLSQQQQDFVSAVSHELKTPLTSIRMYAEMLREGWASEEKRQEYYRFILAESERLSRLIGNVLSFSRVTRRDREVSSEELSVQQLLGPLEAAIAPLVAQHQRSYTLACEPAALTAVLAVDRDALIQIMINLVDNALKFSGKAARQDISINVRAPQSGVVEFAVRDYGPGIPAAERDKVFNLFYRAESGLARETGGTGIGLALVKQLVQGMGGTVDLKPCEPGVEFVVRLLRK